MSEYADAMRALQDGLGATPIAYWTAGETRWVCRAETPGTIRSHARQFHKAPVDGWSDEELLRLHAIAHQGTGPMHVHKEA